MPENKNLAQLLATHKTGNEVFHHGDKTLNIQLIDYWRWSASDLLNNTIRGILAEYIVACAVGAADNVRSPWESYDLETSSGVTIEVKSAAYLQSWYQKKLSPIRFTIRPTRNWNAATSQMENEIKRQADIYVFCVLKHKDKLTVDPLKLEQWDFYILEASVLNNKFPGQKSISLPSLLKLNPLQSKYDKISDCIKELGAKKMKEPDFIANDKELILSIACEGGGQKIYGKKVNGKWSFWAGGGTIDADSEVGWRNWEKPQTSGLFELLPKDWIMFSPISIHPDFIAIFTKAYDQEFATLPPEDVEWSEYQKQRWDKILQR